MKLRILVLDEPSVERNKADATAHEAPDTILGQRLCPLLEKVEYKGGKAILSFKHVGGELKSRDSSAELKFFEIAGADGKYVDAKAAIKGDTVVVSSPEAASPAGVRYLFIKRPPDPAVSLINAEGLPASQLMTDVPKPEKINFK